MQDINYIPEGDVYRLIVKSNLPSAEKFETWIFDEVLPSIRKHGVYMTPAKIEDVLLNPDLIINLATSLKEERSAKERLQLQVEADRSKVLFANAMAVSEDCILIGELAKKLKENGIDIGQNRLFTWLRDNGYLIKRKGDNYNDPTQKSIGLELFEVKVSTHTSADGKIKRMKTTKVTGKGQVYFINRFLRKQESEKTGLAVV